MTSLVAIAAFASIASADSYSFGYSGYHYEVDPKVCNCQDGDPTSKDITFQKIDSVTYNGQCNWQGWCSMTFYFTAGETVTKTISIPRGQCLVGASIALQGTMGYIQCTSGSQCPNGSYTVTTHAATGIFNACPGGNPPGGGN